MFRRLTFKELGKRHVQWRAVVVFTLRKAKVYDRPSDRRATGESKVFPEKTYSG